MGKPQGESHPSGHHLWAAAVERWIPAPRGTDVQAAKVEAEGSDEGVFENG